MATASPNPCPSCGAPRPADAPLGLCPRCLLRGGLESQALSLSRAGEVGATVELGPPSVLETLAESLGPVPRVLLRDTDPASEPPIHQPGSSEMPEPLDRSARIKLLGEIARGGMGAVLKGRDDDLGRDLAVKVLLERHRDNPDLVRRFVEEAQIGGQLQHPGIVPIYELGAFADRRPYFAMKLVKGRTLAELLTAREDPSDSLPRFLGIFEQVCQTVAYAHARGVIHRDLKPSNIMVGSFGEVQVMDWGLAKVLPRGGVVDDAGAGKVPDQETLIATARSGGDPDADLSRAGSVMGTPSYMAPEQARGEVAAIDERADVFALGSILAEILTGQPAFVGRNSGEIQRKAARAETADALARLDTCAADAELVALARDCLAAEPMDRPRDARAVADRATAYLVGVQERLHTSERDRAVAEARAVEERRKRKWQLGLAASIAASLLIGGIGLAAFAAVLDHQKGELARANRELARQRTRAEDNEAAAIAAVKRFSDAVAENPELKDNPELEPLRKALLKEPLAFFRSLCDRLQADADTSPEALARLALAGGELGMLTAEVGREPDALAAYRQALEVWTRLAVDHPAVAEYHRGRAVSHNNLGALMAETGDLTAAQAEYEAARAIQKRLADDHPTVAEYQRDLASSHHNLGILLGKTGDPPRARAEFEAALAIQKRLALDHPDVAQYQRDLANGHNSRGILLARTGDPAGARAEFEAARAIWTRLALDHPDVAEYQHDLANGHNSLGILLAETGDLTGARAELEAALAIRKRLADDHPAVTQYQSELAQSHAVIDILLAETGDLAGARAELEAAKEIQKRLAEDHPDVAQYQRDLAQSHNSLGIHLAKTGDSAGARAEHEAARAIRDRLAEDHPDVAQYQRDLAQSHNSLGDLLAETGDPAGARAEFESALAIEKRLAEAHPESPQNASAVGGTLNNLATLEINARQFDAAAAHLREGIPWLKKALAANPRHPDFRRFLRNHFTLLLAAARGLDDVDLAAEAWRGLAELDAADPRLAALDARLAAVLKGEAPKDDSERLALAQRAYDTGRYAAATRLWSEALESDPTLSESRQAQHAYNAACCAALAAAGEGQDAPKPDDAAQAALRRQALDWLKAELEAWSKVLDSGDPQARAAVAPTLRHWQQDPDLAGVRDDDALAALPDDERQTWQALWDQVGSLLERAESDQP